MLKEAVEVYSRDELKVIVIWIPMLGSDNEYSARQAARMFTDPGVIQFYDANRLSGIAYSRDMFFPHRADAIAAIPEGHFLKERLAAMRDVQPEQMPLWDAALFYPKGTTWGASAPLTDLWSKQLMFVGGGSGQQSTFWVDSLKQPPVETDWYDEVRGQTARLLGKTGDGAAAVPGRKIVQSQTGATPPNRAVAPAPSEPRLGIMMVPHAKGQQLRILGTVAGMPAEKAGVREGDVITKVNGKSVVDMTDVQLIEAWSATDRVKLDVQRSGETLQLELDLSQDESDSSEVQSATPNKPVEVTSLAESLDSLKEHFNKAKGRHRFVTLLSPT